VDLDHIAEVKRIMDQARSITIWSCFNAIWSD
jgi:hypothetical protein